MDDGRIPSADEIESSELEESAGDLAKAQAEHSVRMDMLARNFAKALRGELRTFRGLIQQMVDEAVERAVLDAALRIGQAFASPEGDVVPLKPVADEPVPLPASAAEKSADFPAVVAKARPRGQKPKNPPYVGPCKNCDAQTTAPAFGRYAKLCPNCRGGDTPLAVAGDGESSAPAAPHPEQLLEQLHPGENWPHYEGEE